MTTLSAGRYGFLSMAFAFVLFCQSTASAQTIINKLYGLSTPGYAGDGGPATAARFHNPLNMAIDPSGQMYIADQLNHCIRKVNAGIVTTVAGNGTGGYSGDGGPGTAALLYQPTAVATDAAGNVYIGDYCKIRKLTPAGIITTIAGTGTYGYTGDGGPATAATMGADNLALDASGNIYVSDGGHYVVRKISTAGIITTYAGTGVYASTGDGGPATAAAIAGAGYIAIDGAGNLYIPDQNTYIRKVNSSGIISTIAGTGVTGHSGDGGLATTAQLAYPDAVAIDGSGNLYINDYGGKYTRKINSSGIISTIAGSGVSGCYGDGGPATAADIDVPSLLTDAAGNVYLGATVCYIRKLEIVGIAPIAGSATVCAGYTTTLTDATFGGSWTSSNPSIATIGSGTGVVSAGATAGTTTISYIVGASSVTKTITVNPLPSAISGLTVVCSGRTTLLSDAGGGTWASGSTSVATINSSGIVTGVAAGTAIITYTIASGCIATTTIAVNALPGVITGTLSVCEGGMTTTLSDATSGGTWASSDMSIATVNVTTGVGGSVLAGTAVITYTLGTGCIATSIFTVHPTPVPITGSTGICIYTTGVLTDLSGGGSWSSSDPSVASIDLASGAISGLTVGSSVITYTLPTGCFNTEIETVYGLPAAISGTTIVCLGSTTTLSNSIPGGSWQCSNSSVAPVIPTIGLVTGIAAGTAIIDYTLSTGCYTSTTVTVVSPTSVTGGAVVCVGSSVLLSPGASGGTWSSAHTSIATVGTTGTVFGVSAGTSIITYTLTGCRTTKVVTVIPLPPGIGGATSVCIGSSVTLTDAASGGTWSSANPSIAAINSTTGSVTGVTAGTVILTYAIGTGCMVTRTETVVSSPAPITGVSGICMISCTMLSDAVGGGTWISSNPSIATISSASGNVCSAVTIGTTVITYVLASGCYTTWTEAVLPTPSAITGPASVCDGSSITLSDAITGGIWSSSNSSVATAGTSTGIIIGIASGTATITYSLGTGCIAITSIIVNPLPPGITGTTTVCIGATATLSESLPGGTWSSSDPSIATISTTGAVTGVSAGTTIVSYSVTGGCYASTLITVLSTVPAITGSVAFCSGSSIALSDATSGGTWSSGSPGVATPSSSGLLSGLATGTATITYSISTGCYATAVTTVLPLPAAITGTPAACVGGITTLASTTSGGTWSSSNTAVAPVGSTTGVVSGVAAGTAVVTYATGGCWVLSTVTINPVPGVFTVTGGGSYCSGGAGVHVGMSGSATGIAYQLYHGGTPVGGPVSGTGSSVDFGLITGGFTYTVIATATASGCTAPMAASASISILPLPAAIAGSATLCAGASTTLTDATTGGTWSSSDLTVASIGSATGSLSGISAGTVSISYTLTTGCMVSMAGTVNPLPAAITGTMTLCAGATTMLTDATTGGTWSSSSTAIASVDATGNVQGVSAGTSAITYTLSTGCMESAVVTVNALPTAAASPAHSCGNTYTLTATGGSDYSWSPATGLSCATCATTSTTLAGGTTYTVAVTNTAGCTDTASLSLDGNVISGYITYTGTALDTFKIWLVQFNPSDTSLSALDSTYTCMDGGIPYYEFMDVVAGNYMVKAQLQGTVPGTSGYIPTYSLSTPHWDSAATVSHTSSWDTLHINMVYGTVPPGPGFIGGYISAGAGRGTDGDAPVADMQIILMNTANNALTYTYTDAAGNYAFSGLGYGDYIIYPEFFGFNTIHSDVITLSSTSESIGNIDFRKYNDSKVIMPAVPSIVRPAPNSGRITIYPNPTTGTLNVAGLNGAAAGSEVVITDVTGRKVFGTTVKADKAATAQVVDISMLQSGVYAISIQSGERYFTGKLVIEK